MVSRNESRQHVVVDVCGPGLGLASGSPVLPLSWQAGHRVEYQDGREGCGRLQWPQVRMNMSGGG